MSRRNHKRFIYLLHRWSGIFAAVPMALWFLSGIVMLFVGYPKLYPWEHIARLAPLQNQNCCVDLATALASLPPTDAAVSKLRLVTIAGRPQYQVSRGARIDAVDAQTGASIQEADAELALASVASYLPGSSPVYGKQVQTDIWTRSGSLNLHRPLHKILAHDAANTVVYVSSRTGEVVLMVDEWTRRWNYLGAWLHWLYLFRDASPDPVWHWLVVILSIVGTITTVAGTMVGLWRWRLRRRYRSGLSTPYPPGAMRWHHLTGLAFCGITLTWIFSGLMSMNPLGVLSPQETPDRTAYQGRPLVADNFEQSAIDFIAKLPMSDLREIQWSIVGGQPYLIGRSGSNQIVTLQASRQGGLIREIDKTELLKAAQRLYPANPIISAQRLEQHDTYYYPRAPQAMRGARDKPLPILRVRFSDPGATWVHIDPRTGNIESTMDSRQRMGRWLFEFLHSWDLPIMLATGSWRTLALIILSLGGLVLSVTGIWIGYQRLKR